MSRFLKFLCILMRIMGGKVYPSSSKLNSFYSFFINVMHISMILVHAFQKLMILAMKSEKSLEYFSKFISNIFYHSVLLVIPVTLLVKGKNLQKWLKLKKNKKTKFHIGRYILLSHIFIAVGQEAYYVFPNPSISPVYYSYVACLFRIFMIFNFELMLDISSRFDEINLLSESIKELELIRIAKEVEFIHDYGRSFFLFNIIANFIFVIRLLAFGSSYVVHLILYLSLASSDVLSSLFIPDLLHDKVRNFFNS